VNHPKPKIKVRIAIAKHWRGIFVVKFNLEAYAMTIANSHDKRQDPSSKKQKS
jgi:hypothetical protein